jgi:hypothetical protein
VNGVDRPRRLAAGKQVKSVEMSPQRRATHFGALRLFADARRSRAPTIDAGIRETSEIRG